MKGLDHWIGLARSMWIYRRPGRLGGLMTLYRPFVQPGDLVFDIGAHLGDRTRAFRRLGARVVALEPQPALMQWLDRFHGEDDGIVLDRRAAGDRPGSARLAVSARHPSVASLSSEWRQAVSGRGQGFDHVRWSEAVDVEVTTLDALIETHGCPAFCKIDVEGFEAAVLAGLSSPLPAVSVEFVSGALPLAIDCVDRLQSLADYRYNAVAGEGRRFLWSQARPAEDLRHWLENGADGISSGDLYATQSDSGDGAHGRALG